MVENGFSPAGLRVLVVDDDPTWLKILEKMLKKCSYEVTTCGLARDALRLLRERKDGFDIVISDVYMPDMDGFKLLEHVGLEMDLPVIMMSVDGETSRVMKGVQHGACDYLLKPIRMKELRNIWQHVLRKKIHEIRDIEVLEAVEDFQMTRNGSDYSNDGYFFGGEDVNSMKKRKDIENKHIDDFGESSSAKKSRVVWSVVLHQKFVKAVNQIGFDKVGPKKILDLMNVPGLTRENVASHLQKYRLYLSRLQKENDVKICAGGLNHPDSPSRDSAGNLAIQNSIKLQHNDVPNGSYGFSGDNNLLIQDMGPQSHEGDQEGIVSKLATEPKRALVVDVPETRKPRSPQIEFGPSFRPSEGEVNFAAFDSTFPSQYPWHGLPDIQLKQEPQSLNLDDGFNNLPLSIDYPQSAPFVSSRPSLPEKDEYKINKRNRVSSSTSEVGSNFNENMAYMKTQAVELTSTGTSNMGKQDFDLSCITRSESAKKSINWGIQPFANLDEEWKASLVQNDCYSRNFGLQNIDFQGYFEQGFLGDHIPNDGLRFDYENLYEPTEYNSLIDQSLFIT